MALGLVGAFKRTYSETVDILSPFASKFSEGFGSDV
jgi:hypothetical protein